ncbi:MBL fold metallo-hydrolase [Maritimibacter sp. DP1N21-5]|uniref:MBL fold metallo-hydrolase n=1 Tax=Maritimibacter sp. DP1N21-5 TaxID=2836867 RepID=UPI001C440A75|nr:MBL fold metallo-hydrolase [Maritimibacter sp. DP1N21-5]MBV7408132.1 MBL fold metallo-hydrolase [Maritimibacter sp. DP1N21-5]
MKQTRRMFLASAAAAGGVVTILPITARAASHGMGGDMFETDAGTITVHPVHHASIVLETPAGTIYVDPVGEAALYEGMPAPDLILVTHEHGDHYNAETLAAIMAEGTTLVTNPAVQGMLPPELGEGAIAMANGDTTDWEGVAIEAIPAQNVTEERLNFHPPGRDNGYVLTIDGFRIYISGDTEPTPEMLALTDIDLCFLCMNLPFTMTAEQAAEAVAEFRPAAVYPYHYRGQDGGTQDPETFAELVGENAEVKMGEWYEPGELG